jgi:hypothetical protein
MDGYQLREETFVDFAELLLVVLAKDDLHEVFAVARGPDGHFGCFAQKPEVFLSEGRVVGFAHDVAHVLLGFPHFFEGHSQEGQQPHHA